MGNILNVLTHVKSVISWTNCCLPCDIIFPFSLHFLSPTFPFHSFNQTDPKLYNNILSNSIMLSSLKYVFFFGCKYVDILAHSQKFLLLLFYLIQYSTNL